MKEDYTLCKKCGHNTSKEYLRTYGICKTCFSMGKITVLNPQYRFTYLMLKENKFKGGRKIR